MKTTTIRLGGRERELAFDFNAMSYLDTEGGINVFQGMNFEEFRRPSKMLLLITAMLQSDALKNKETLTKEQVGAMLDLAAMNVFNSKLQEVVENSLPEDDEKADPPVRDP